jgi:hypothetical protein
MFSTHVHVIHKDLGERPEVNLCIRQHLDLHQSHTCKRFSLPYPDCLCRERLLAMIFHQCCYFQKELQPMAGHSFHSSLGHLFLDFLFSLL